MHPFPLSPEAEALVAEIGVAQFIVRKRQGVLEDLRMRGVVAEQELVIAKMKLEGLQTRLAVAVADAAKAEGKPA